MNPLRRPLSAVVILMNYPPRLEIVPLPRTPSAEVRVPGSKSITNRALVLAALTGRCLLTGVLQSEDTEVMVDSLDRLGFSVEADWESATIGVLAPRSGRRIPARVAELNVANSGTTMRFLTAMVALGHGRYRLDGVPRMRERPIRDLLDALTQAGVHVRSENGNGCPPVIVDADGLPGGELAIKGDVSSQFLSGLLMAAPFAERDVTLRVDGPLVSVPYVTMTLAMLGQLGLKASHESYQVFHVPGGQTGGIAEYAIEPDASAASYFLAAAAITGGRIAVSGLGRTSLQGDVRFADVLGQMGCRVEWETGAITVAGGPLRGIDVDMNDISDTVMTLAAVACFAEGPTTIRNVGHIRHKETDRLAALAAELRRLGANVEEKPDGLTIVPAKLTGTIVQTYNDHRMAMSLALIGLRVPGVEIDNPACVAKTYPRFFEDLEALR
jgi:3-phosphoshikimate 1-carboxyvinyltransferase